MPPHTGEHSLRERVTADDTSACQQVSQAFKEEFCYFREGGKGSYMNICV